MESVSKQQSQGQNTQKTIGVSSPSHLGGSTSHPASCNNQQSSYSLSQSLSQKKASPSIQSSTSKSSTTKKDVHYFVSPKAHNKRKHVGGASQSVPFINSSQSYSNGNDQVDLKKRVVNSKIEQVDLVGQQESEGSKGNEVIRVRQSIEGNSKESQGTAAVVGEQLKTLEVFEEKSDGITLVRLKKTKKKKKKSSTNGIIKKKASSVSPDSRGGFINNGSSVCFDVHKSVEEVAVNGGAQLSIQLDAELVEPQKIINEQGNKEQGIVTSQQVEQNHATSGLIKGVNKKFERVISNSHLVAIASNVSKKDRKGSPSNIKEQLGGAVKAKKSGKNELRNSKQSEGNQSSTGLFSKSVTSNRQVTTTSPAKFFQSVVANHNGGGGVSGVVVVGSAIQVPSVQQLAYTSLKGSKSQTKMMNGHVKASGNFSSHNLEQSTRLLNKEEAQRIRRERVGLGFLNDKDGAFVEQVVQKSKERLRQSTNELKSDSEQQASSKKKLVLDSERLKEIHRFIASKRRQQEQENQNKFFMKTSKERKIQENQSNLEQSIRSILHRMSSKKQQHQQQQQKQHQSMQQTGFVASMGGSQFMKNKMMELLRNANSSHTSTLQNDEFDDFQMLYDEYRKILHTESATSTEQNSHNASSIKGQVKEKQEKGQLKSISSESGNQKVKVIHSKLSNGQVDSSSVRGRERTQNMKDRFSELSQQFHRIIGTQAISRTSGSASTLSQSQSQLPQLSSQQQQSLLTQSSNRIASSLPAAAAAPVSIRAHQIQQEVFGGAANQHIPVVGKPSEEDYDKNKKNQQMKKDESSKVNQETYEASHSQIDSEDSMQLRESQHNKLDMDQEKEGEGDVQQEKQEHTIMATKTTTTTEEDQMNYIAIQYLNHSAILIQKIWRGYQTRQLLYSYLEEFHNQNAQYDEDEEYLAHRHLQQHREQHEVFDQHQEEGEAVNGHVEEKVINISTIAKPSIKQEPTNHENGSTSPLKPNNQLALKPQQQYQTQLLKGNQGLLSNQENSNAIGKQASSSNAIFDSNGELLYIRSASAKKKRTELSERHHHAVSSQSGENYEEELNRLKELEIEKWQLISAHLQNAQTLLNAHERQKLLSSLQELSEHNKNELLSSLTYKNKSSTSSSPNHRVRNRTLAVTEIEGGEANDNERTGDINPLNENEEEEREDGVGVESVRQGKSPSSQGLEEYSRENRQTTEKKHGQNFVDDDNKNNKRERLQGTEMIPCLSDRSIKLTKQPLQLLHQQESLRQQKGTAAAAAIGGCLGQEESVNQSAARQELNQLYFLLAQETTKDKERKYLYSSLSQQHSSSSNLNSQRNSSRVKLPDEAAYAAGTTTAAGVSGSASIAFVSGGYVGNESESQVQSTSSSWFDRDSFKMFTEKKLKELLQHDQIEEIVRVREQSIQMRHSTQVAVMNRMLSENVVSPRTYTQNKQELDDWAKQEHADLSQTRSEFEKSIQRAIDSISKAKRDVDFSDNCRIGGGAGAGVGVAANAPLNSLEEEQRYYINSNEEGNEEIEEVEGIDADFQRMTEDINESKEEENEQFEMKKKKKKAAVVVHENRWSEQQLQAAIIEGKAKEDILEENDDDHLVQVFDASPVPQGTAYAAPSFERDATAVENTRNIISMQQVFGLNSEIDGEDQVLGDATTVSQANILKNACVGSPREMSDILEEDEEGSSQANLSSNLSHMNGSHLVPAGHNFSTQAMAVTEVFNTINEEIKEKWRMNAQVEERLNEQLNRVECIDKSERFGIASNLFVVDKYLISLFEYVKEHYEEELIGNINTAFGFSPQKRLKLIHGYESYLDVAGTDCQLEEFSTLPFVLSEELFIEFEQNIIGNGDEEREQIIKEFQHIHNKAIFDSFNESLNLFRPFFALGGSPYSWSFHEKNVVVYEASHTSLDGILEKAKKKVLDWASFLCGIINEHEIFTPPIPNSVGSSEQHSISRRRNGGGVDLINIEENSVESNESFSDNQIREVSPLQSLLDNHSMQPENEYFAQSREERLSRMLLVEILENEYKWQLFEDEKAEVLMELSDLVFEELIEEIVDEISEF